MTFNNSTSNINVALAGMTFPAPLDPYQSSGGIVNFLLPPTFMPSTPSSQPLITLPAPKGKLNGALPILVSNCVPSSKVPV